MSIVISVVLLALNGFFVAAEFALIAAKRHRLEQAAETSRAARAAVAGVRELSLMLAGAQLGITLCTLGLGALAKPAVADLLEPALRLTGLPEAFAYGIAFAISLVLVVFLHMVVGEMAPKSWAIANPERSALILALPFRAFARSVRWLLSGLNGVTNSLLRLMKVEPQDELAQAHRPDDLRMLLRQSAEHGLIPEAQQRLLTRMLQVQRTTVSEVMVPIEETSTVTEHTTAQEIERRSLQCGRSRFPVTDQRGDYVGLVHIREAMRATDRGEDLPARELMGPVLTLPASMPVAQAVTAMREARAQLALVADDSAVTTTRDARAQLTLAADHASSRRSSGRLFGSTAEGDSGRSGGRTADLPANEPPSPEERPISGIAALEDLLEELIGDFEDETDTRPVGVR
ncbi:hemolysin family protein [Lentzea sp. BCCO 10_0798]|uniref:Hemolysin family protein n=1 Tax=Lentzea kristufekii TaxID=3095430 RepID=A0ABU4U114_9PSEU|nr:hemolysin family protein [Lentzea sp. BCCO 10_0798]MDX8054264.1 hemolysin family protein [Lentzea sp. BCCO 10_0798]